MPLVVVQFVLLLDAALKNLCISIVFHFHTSNHNLFSPSYTTQPKHSLPEDVTMEQLMDVLGPTRLKKMARKNRRSRNQKIREGKVVLNERGEWVERD